MRHISQREAHRLRKRVEQLERLEESRQRRWSSEYAGGLNIATEPNCHEGVLAAINTARLLGHYVVCTTRGNEILFHAVK